MLITAASSEDAHFYRGERAPQKVYDLYACEIGKNYEIRLQDIFLNIVGIETCSTSWKIWAIDFPN